MNRSAKPRRPRRTTYKLVALIVLAITALTVLVWVNQQNVREIGPGRPPTQSG